MASLSSSSTREWWTELATHESLVYHRNNTSVTHVSWESVPVQLKMLLASHMEKLLKPGADTFRHVHRVKKNFQVHRSFHSHLTQLATVQDPHVGALLASATYADGRLRNVHTVAAWFECMLAGPEFVDTWAQDVEVHLETLPPKSNGGGRKRKVVQ